MATVRNLACIAFRPEALDVHGQGLDLRVQSVLEISNIWQILSLEFQKFFSILEQYFLTVGQNNFGNTISVDSADISWIQNQDFLRVIRILCIIAAAVEYRLRLLHTVHPFNLQRTLCVFLTLWTKLINFVQKL